MVKENNKFTSTERQKLSRPGHARNKRKMTLSQNRRTNQARLSADRLGTKMCLQKIRLDSKDGDQI